jgi:PAS domain S-box-containing protein
MVGKPSPESERLDGELMRRVVDGVPAILSYWGPDQRCRFANRAYERWFGVSPESMVGQHAREFLGPAYPLLLPHIEAALGGEPQQFERDLPDPSGGPVRQSLVRYVPDVEGGIVRGFFVLVSDISELKRTQMALRESEARFAHLYEMAMRANHSRDEVLAIIAHDLRNPLATIRLAAKALPHRLRPDAAPGVAKAVAPILRSVDRADHLISDLLDAARLENGQLTIDRQSISANELLEEAVDAGRALAAAASVELRLEAGGELPMVEADRSRIFQVIGNLVGNAVKFTAPGGRVTVRATAGPREVRFSVADTGVGIPGGNLPHIFDRYWRANPAERSGTGLGLAICKGLVEAHGGRIWAESAPGRGTTLYFTIPSCSLAGDTMAASFV